jgi:hypothetical protein
MTDIEQKKLSLHGRLRIAAACPDANASLFAEAADAIEQHEAFRQEVSDVVEAYIYGDGGPNDRGNLKILMMSPKPKPDPLVRVINEVIYAQPHGDIDEVRMADNFRAALEARGLEIRSKADAK